MTSMNQKRATRALALCASAAFLLTGCGDGGGDDSSTKVLPCNPVTALVTLGLACIVPIVDSVSDNGNNSNYTIVKFVSLKIVHVDMQGANKKIFVQPADISISGGITNTINTQTSIQIYSVPSLVQ